MRHQLRNIAIEKETENTVTFEASSVICEPLSPEDSCKNNMKILTSLILRPAPEEGRCLFYYLNLDGSLYSINTSRITTGPTGCYNVSMCADALQNQK
jgi:hypothetical protein